MGMVMGISVRREMSAILTYLLTYGRRARVRVRDADVTVTDRLIASG